MKGENITLSVYRTCPGITDQHDQIPNKKDRLQSIRHSAKLQRRDVRESGLRSASTQLVNGLVSNAAFDASKMHNPFNFQHYNLTEIAIYLDRQLQDVLKTIQPNFKENLYTCLQLAVLGYGQTKQRRGHRHLARRLQKCYTLYAFDLTANLG